MVEVLYICTFLLPKTYKMGKQLNAIMGQMYGCYRVVSDEIFKIKDSNREHYRGYLKVLCTLCDTEHFVRSDTLKKGEAKKCRACSNKEKYLKNVKDKKIAFKGYSLKHRGSGDFTKTQLLRIKHSCNKRGIRWDETYMNTENLWNLLISQNHKCAISGLDIWLSKGDNISMQTDQRNLNYDGWNASLDRVDSSKGYVEGNLQWVHRDINFMKNTHSQDYFIKLCKIIAKNNE